MDREFQRFISSAQNGFNWYNEGQDDAVLDEFPAQELFRCADEPTKDWIKIWEWAGGRFFEGRMIALKNDPIWSRISKFGLPYPPFADDQAMWVRDVDRSDAERIGVISRREVVVREKRRLWSDDAKVFQAKWLRKKPAEE